MVWVRKADLRSTVPGPEGPQGLPGVNGVENDTAMATNVNGPSETRTALLKNGLTGWLHVDGFGADPTGVADSTAAIQAAIAAAGPGDTIYFAATGSGSGYKITGNAIEIATPNLRFMASPRDAYATSLRCVDPSTTMIKVKAPGFVFHDIGLIGDGGGNGAGATITGVEMFGDTDGNVDAAIRGATFQYLALGVLLHGRNTEISQNSLFSNCLAGVRHAGKDGVYHTGPGADQNRGNVIRDSRFHNIGTTSTHACVEFTDQSMLLHAMVHDNHFDSGGLGRHVVVTGTASNPAKGFTASGNKHTEASAEAYDLTYCYYPQLSGFQILGNTVSGAWGNGVKLTNTVTAMVRDFSIIQVGKDGIVAKNTTGTVVADGNIIQVGLDPATVGNALNFDSTNAYPRFSHIMAENGDGWFFTGEPTGDLRSMTDCAWTGFTLGGINSLTMVNRAQRGVNTYVEGKFGRIEDVGYKSYDLAAGVAKTVATVTAGGSFSTFLLEVELTGNTSGNLVGHLFARRMVNPANGVPVVTTIGTDAASQVTLTIASGGPTTVTVSVTPTNALFASVKVRTSVVGATNATNRRDAVIVMA